MQIFRAAELGTHLSLPSPFPPPLIISGFWRKPFAVNMQKLVEIRLYNPSLFSNFVNF